jgi:hypothetical protein
MYVLKTTLLIVATTMLLQSGASVAQSQPQTQDPARVAEELAATRKLNEAKREATIAANVEFTMAEKSAFWPLYWEYRTQVNKVDDAYIRILDEYAKKYQSMDNATAERLTTAWLQTQLDRYTLKKQYIERFNSAIPAAKALRVFQIENKLDQMIDAELGKQVPLSVPGS